MPASADLLIDVLRARAPSDVAARCDGAALTFGAWDDAAGRIARRLRSAGVGRGDLVCVGLPVSFAYLEAVAGVQLAGATPAGVNMRLPEATVRALATTVRPAAWIGANAPLGVHGVDVQGMDLGQDELVPRQPARPDDDALVVFTSGTTALPRAATFSIRALHAVARAEATDDPHGPGVVLGAMPPGNLFMATRLPSILARGGSVVLLSSWDPAAALRAVREDGVDTIPGVPTQFADLLAEPNEGERLRRCIIGGATAPHGMVRALHERFGCEVVVRYSTTETGMITSSGPITDDDGTVGRALPGVQIRIDGGRVSVRSEAAMRGYWGRPPAPAWIATGDRGSLDSEGRLRLLGRVDDAFTRAGTTIDPHAIEAVLRRCPGVTDVVVVGIEDARLGARAIAFVVGAALPAAVSEHARVHLATYLIPDEIRTIDAIPCTAAGKPDRRALRAD